MTLYEDISTVLVICANSDYEKYLRVGHLVQILICHVDLEGVDT